MKRKFWIASLAAFLLFGSGMAVSAETTQPSQPETAKESYWSEESAPLIYGPSKITIPVGTDFDAKDTRFRVFAKDFEDKDVSQSLEFTGEVDSEKPGDYVLTYTAEDSHGNKTTKDVTVTVSAETEKIVVQRTMYTTPSVWNMDLAGFSRNNYGDSQHLGIFMPEGSSIRMRILDGSKKLSVYLYGNDSKQETTVNLPLGEGWTEISNVKSGTPYAAVPLVSTPVMEKGVALDKTYTIEVEYGTDVEELNYYLQGDDEEAFRKEWNEEQHTFGVIENSALTAVVPYADLTKATNHFTNGFKTLDEFGDYWERVVDRMDELVGLEDDPQESIHQNVPTRFVVKANRHGAGAAYYSGSHVGINSASMAAFFEMNWGGLHEFAHGYQGSLGRGDMGLGEVSNNIIGYYIQTDKSIYKHPGNWLGDFATREDYFHKNRLQGATWEATGVDIRLYMICNLFDHFEGGETYREMFRWYREQLEAGRTIGNIDAYAESLAEIYGKNVIPYMEAWGLKVGQETRDKVYQMKLPAVSILKDIVSDENLTQIMEGQQTKEKFEIVTSDAYQGITDSAVISINVEDFSEIQGKKLKIFDGKTLVREVVVDAEEMNISDLPVGIYTLQMPGSRLYSNDGEYLVVKEDGNNVVEVNYSALADVDFNTGVTFKMQGIHNTYGCQVNVNSDFTKATLSFGGADMGSSNPYVKILDETGKPVAEEIVTPSGSNDYFPHTKKAYDVALEPGYVIELAHPNKGKVHVVSNITGANIPEFAAKNNVTRYVVMENGIYEESAMTKEDGANALYQVEKALYDNIITSYQSTVTKAELYDPDLDVKGKERVLAAYANLRAEDQATYADFVESIIVEEENFHGNLLTLKVRGIYNTFGYTLNFNQDYSQATVITGAANIGTDKPYVKIFDEEGNQVSQEVVTKVGNAFYFEYQKEDYQVDLKPGYVIEVYHPNKARVLAFSNLVEGTIQEFMPEGETTRYIVMKGGLRKENMTPKQASDISASLVQQN